MDETTNAALLLMSVGLLMAGLGAFFAGFAQFVKSDREGKGFFKR